MKAIKYLMLGALTVGFSTSVMAQDGTAADIDAVKKIISSKPADLDKQMKPYYKENKKKADNLVAFGRAFLAEKDTANAKKYAEYALAASKNKYAPAFVLLGDIASMSDDGGGAAQLYDQAIYADPKLVDAYTRYALVYSKIDPKGAAQKLEDLRINCPEVNIDAIKGHIFMIGADRATDRKQVQENRKQAYESFMKANINDLDNIALNEFVRASYFTGHTEDAFRVAEAGLKLEPRNATFNRMAMFSSYDLKNYDVAKNYINKYFNESDSVTFSEYDYYYAGLIYDALDDKENTTASYNKALELVTETSAVKRFDILKKLSDLNLKNRDFENAIKYYNESVASNPKTTYADVEGLADIYVKYAAEDESKKEEYIKKAAEVYRNSITDYPKSLAYSYWKAGGTLHKLDPTMEKALAMDDYQKVAEALGEKAELTGNEKIYLKTSYNYMMFYNLNKKNNISAAKEFAEKILVLDPEFEPALKIKELK